MTNRREGLYGAILKSDLQSFAVTPFLVARYPGAVGEACDSFVVTVESSPSPIGIAFDRIGSTDTIVQCAAGSFSSYRYDLVLDIDTVTGPPVRTGDWSAWAPGVGLVRSVNAFGRGGEVKYYQLRSYELK